MKLIEILGYYYQAYLIDITNFRWGAIIATVLFSILLLIVLNSEEVKSFTVLARVLTCLKYLLFIPLLSGGMPSSILFQEHPEVIGNQLFIELMVLQILVLVLLFYHSTKTGSTEGIVSGIFFIIFCLLALFTPIVTWLSGAGPIWFGKPLGMLFLNAFISYRVIWVVALVVDPVVTLVSVRENN